ncbi:MAG TPA: hypothetical protein VHY37_05420 [Tepidisphaeraceae bacterium]|jgi:hypothetical protein|nr:hypothetical protein [Tepidisphaeraceae bacterium]
MLEDDAPVVAVFYDRSTAVAAINSLLAAGFPADRIGYITKQSDTPDDIHGNLSGSCELAGAAADERRDVATGMIAGGMIGGVVAAGLTLLVPGIGPILAGGVLASFFGGALAGTAVGGLLGALSNLGIPHDLAKRYEAEFHAGATLVAVHAGSRAADAAEILARHGGAHIHREADPGALSHPTSSST